MIRHFIFLACALLWHCAGFSQTARQTGLREYSPGVYAFTNARIIINPQLTIDSGMMIVRNGLIEAVGKKVNIPADAQITDFGGKYIYPGFIDIFCEYGITYPAPGEMPGQIHWSSHVRSDFHAADLFRPSDKDAVSMRSQGFVVANIVPQQGIFAGQGAIVSLGDGQVSELLLQKGTCQVVKLQQVSSPRREYPQSLMGALSLVRQTLLDAKWYADAHQAHASAIQASARPETNPVLQILADDLDAGKPIIIELPDEQWVNRAERLAKEFGLNLWIKASGYEYRMAPDREPVIFPLLVSLDFPAQPEISSPEEAMDVSLEALRHWYFAPGNPAVLADRKAVISITSSGLKNKADFLKNLRLSVNHGLSESDALAALTTTPAKLLGLERHFGTLEKGKTASFIVASGNLFEPGSEVEQVWIDGKKYQVKPDRHDPRGEWLIVSANYINGISIMIDGDLNRLKGEAVRDGKKTLLQAVKADHQRLSFRFSADSIGLKDHYRMSADISGDELLGLGDDRSGNVFTWRGQRQSKTEDQKRLKPVDIRELSQLPVRHPSIDYGMRHRPSSHPLVLIRDATIWTQGPKGIMVHADMLVSNGKIAEIGHGIVSPGNALIIDAHGMHITPGLIDPHLHTSVAGNVNETASAVTSETRILDVIDANNVWLYRLLAGGLTTAKLFHGSANPIGGQDAVIKMRWGESSDGLVMTDAKPGLKFALGENVKRSPDRYPNTRMGTREIIRDAFEAALRYESDWKRWNRDRKGIPPRRDLQLEPILEVLRGQRLSHVHAYRQDEMLMIMRLAEEYGFTVTAFEHTLEGYKIADELRNHGAAAVVWTDWSSFKVEAADGILQNARLLSDAGVLTSLHSDNTQLSTRMNWEAAKVLKTGVSEVEAMNMITLNPAKILRVDHLVGSLEKGKDADFVIWNGHPLSSFTTAEQTWIEGKKYFDRIDDAQLQEEIRQERAMIIRHMEDKKSDENK